MKNILSSLVIAFAMYSKVPMPRVDWTKPRMKYVLVFFPFVGILVGGCVFGVLYLASICSVSPLLFAGIVTVVPILLTGGIHFDGYIDTVDAISSYQTRERKLEILKDPHVGAFGVIYAIVYIVLFFAGVCGVLAISEYLKEAIFAVSFAFILSRCLSGFCGVNFKSASAGSLSVFKDASVKIASNIAILVFALCTCMSLLIFANLFGIVVVAVQLVWMGIYKVRMENIFGGVTGDTAGYFLQIAEVLSVLAVAGMGVII